MCEWVELKMVRIDTLMAIRIDTLIEIRIDTLMAIRIDNSSSKSMAFINYCVA